MALEWTVGNCKNKDSLFTAKEKCVTEVIILSTMVTGIRNITPDNWLEFYHRIRLFEKARGPFMYDVAEGDNPGPPRWITREDVKARIGLDTNASDKTWNQFIRFIGNLCLQDLKREQMEAVKK